MVRSLLAGAALAAMFVATPVSAQVLGLPIVNNGAPTGIAVGAEVGFSNADAGKGTAFGAHAALGIGFVGVSAAVSRFTPDGGDGVWSTGLAGTLRLLGGPLVPFRVVLQGGVAHWSISDVSVTRFPLSLGIAATIPNPAFSLKPWIAPRIDLQHSTFNRTSDNSAKFGMSGGIDVGLINGLTFRGAYDKRFVKGLKPGILSFGVGFGL